VLFPFAYFVPLKRATSRMAVVKLVPVVHTSPGRKFRHRSKLQRSKLHRGVSPWRVESRFQADHHPRSTKCAVACLKLVGREEVGQKSGCPWGSGLGTRKRAGGKLKRRPLVRRLFVVFWFNIWFWLPVKSQLGFWYNSSISSMYASASPPPFL
jgi:hypothetical protein